ncbi:MAG: ABC transporter substrate-binding protein [Bacteroidetes bacterium]|nr:ABC transporter substrate-binding protein [Bacteroidota bacterium]
MQRFCFTILCLFLFASCNHPDYKNNTKKVFRYNESAGITSLDPAFSKDQSNIWVCNQLFNGLVQLDEQLKVQPCIASHWSISADGKTYTFTIRKDVYFHKSTIFKDSTRKVVANDFVYSFNRIVDEKIASPGAWIFNYVKKENGKYAFIARNDSILEIKLNQSFPPFLGLLSMQYCSVIPHEAIDFYGKDFRKNPIGTGAFQLKLWKEGVKLVLLKNTNYFEFEDTTRLPYLDAIAITFIIDKQSVFLEFIKGNIDFMSGIDASYKDELLTVNGKLNPKYKNKFQLISQPYLNTEYLAFLMDTSHTELNNNPVKYKAVRQAINYGFDRVKMMRYLRNNIGTPALYGFIPKGLPSFDTVKVKGYDYQPDKSRKLLADAGFANGEGLGDITLSTTASYLDLCKYIQNQLTEIGLKIKIDVNPPATLREMIAKSKIPFFRGSWIADYPDAENYLSLFYSPNFCPIGPNYTHFSNKNFDLIYNKAQNEVNDSIRYNYYNQMDQIIMNEAPVVVLYYDQVLRFVQNNIQGLGSNPMNLLTLKKVKKQ